MALIEQTVPIGVYEVTCDETGCTARFKGVYGLTDETVRVVAVTDGWTCDVSGDWCPEHAPATTDGTHALIERGVAAGLVAFVAAMDDIPLLQRGYSRPIGEAEQTSLDALESAIAPFHADTNAQIGQRRSYLDEMTAAYLADLARALKDVVLVEERDGLTMRWWFERKGDR